MARLLIILLLLGFLVWGLYWFRTTPTPRVVRVLRRALLWGGLGLLLLAVATGRLTPLFAAIAAAVPALLALVFRLLNLLIMLPMIQQALSSLGVRTGHRGGAGGRADAAGESRIRTRYLDMTLDQVSGRMDGVVLDGPFTGARLSSLERAQLARMLEFYLDSDAQSAAVLRAYLERTDPGQSRGHHGGRADAGGPTTASSQLTQEEACAILGLTPSPAPEAIRAAHRRLMQKFHPDRGGSDYLAAKINEAKQRLLNEQKHG